MLREHSLTPWVGAVSRLRFWLTAGVLRRQRRERQSYIEDGLKKGALIWRLGQRENQIRGSTVIAYLVFLSLVLVGSWAVLGLLDYLRPVSRNSAAATTRVSLYRCASGMCLVTR